ncbi:MAG: AAA family ATPase [Syntrophobacteraceae bacterium]
METISGKIISMRGPYNDGWCIANVSSDSPTPETVVGALAEFQPGDRVTFEGAFRTHPKYGRQFAAANAVLDVPRDTAGIQEYLHRSFRWIGPVLAERLTSTFGEDLFTVMESTPERLASIPGITSERASQIHEEYLAVKSDREDDLWFSRHHITLSTKSRLVDAYGSKADAIRHIRQNPYLLADEVFGIGFKKADAIALSIGISRDSAVRAGACLRFVLSEAASEGHTYLPVPDLAARVLEMIGSNNDALVHDAITDGLRSGKITSHPNPGEEHIYQSHLYNAEQAIAAKLRALASVPHAQLMSELTYSDIGSLDPDQTKALELSLTSKILIITGGPGTGKTYTINQIIRALSSPPAPAGGGQPVSGDTPQIELAAPTGKAAKRMSEMTGREARTIHRLLEFNPAYGGFTRNANDPLDCDTLILDETSMIDVPLMASLLDAITPSTQLIFVGDVDQLPSVGPGSVLRDMIDSGILPVARLDTLHRQAAQSLINRNAQSIRYGEKPDLHRTGDFVFVPEGSAEKIPDRILQVISAIPENFCLYNGLLFQRQPSDDALPPEGSPVRYFTPSDIQVLCPQKRSPVGVDNLNKILRPVLNPTGAELAGTSFLSGDRVIQTKNNYSLEIYNGDIGTVTGSSSHYLYIDFEDLKGTRSIEYPKEDQKELQLAFALTIHKSQGSEFPIVIIPVHTTNYLMLQRNLIYTGITRGKKLVVLVGSTKALNLAIKTVDSTKRFTNLKMWLKEGINEG